MKVLIVNPIIYTSETRKIKKVNSIRDTMIYDLCLGFMNIGVDVTLAAGEDYRPANNEDYPFQVVWLKQKLKRLFPANSLPFCPDIIKLIKNNRYDLIITSEIFSLNSLMLAIKSPKNLIVWHELAKHNKIMREIPSHIWYGIVARLCFNHVTIVPRSLEAKNFISAFIKPKNIASQIIDHGVNLDKFKTKTDKENFFIVSSQLIKRKKIDKIIENFADYLKKYDKNCKLYILGDGDEKDNLINLADELKVSDNIIFTGKLAHNELKKYLAAAMAMLVNTEKDNNMVSIVESIACATPVITTTVPYNASYIKSNDLGIAKDHWDCDDMHEAAFNHSYIENCLRYRENLSCDKKAQTFIDIFNDNKF